MRLERKIGVPNWIQVPDSLRNFRFISADPTSNFVKVPFRESARINLPTSLTISKIKRFLANKNVNKKRTYKNSPGWKPPAPRRGSIGIPSGCTASIEIGLTFKHDLYAFSFICRLTYSASASKIIFCKKFCKKNQISRLHTFFRLQRAHPKSCTEHDGS